MASLSRIGILAIVALCLSISFSCVHQKTGPVPCRRAFNSSSIFTYYIDPRFSGEEVGDIEHAMSLWTEASGNTLHWAPVFEPDVERPDIIFIMALTREEVLPQVDMPFIGLYIDGKVYIIEPEVSIWKVMMLPVAVHEIGHFLGLVHSQSQHSCMTPNVSTICLDSGHIPDVDVRSYCAIQECSCQ